MATINECENAIRMYNGFAIGKIQLRVKFSKTEEERNRQAREKQVIFLFFDQNYIAIQNKRIVKSQYERKECFNCS